MRAPDLTSRELSILASGLLWSGATTMGGLTNT